jgi:putative sterol carrier protein
MPKFETMVDLIENLCGEFRPGHAVNERATIQLDLSGAEAGRYWVRIDNGSCSCGRGDAPLPPDVTLMASTEDWLKLINDEMMSVTAFLQGKLKVQGNKGIAIKIQRWFED